MEQIWHNQFQTRTTEIIVAVTFVLQTFIIYLFAHLILELLRLN